MKSLMQRVDRFCIRHPRFGVSNLMLYVVGGNALVFLLSMMDTTGLLLSNMLFSPARILRGQVWRLLTFALIPDSNGIWTLIFLYFYYFIGNTLERHMGTAKFNVYFFSGILLTVLYGFVIYFLFRTDVRVSAHYIYLSMFLTFAALYPDMQVLLFFVIPIKMKWLALLDLGYFLIDVFSVAFPYNLLPVVAVFNALLFSWDDLPLPRKKTRSQRQEFRNFHREVDRINAERRTRSYRFKCEVCGRTDESDPSLDFRYCSRCQGYHCFCMDHINNHRHFTE